MGNRLSLRRNRNKNYRHANLFNKITAEELEKSKERN